MGSRVNEISKLTSTDATTVKPKGRNHSPDTPGMKATESELAAYADGVIVGSAFVKVLADAPAE